VSKLKLVEDNFSVRTKIVTDSGRRTIFQSRISERLKLVEGQFFSPKNNVEKEK